jgi:hypothetical protein
VTARVAELMDMAEESGCDDSIILDRNGNVIVGLELLTEQQ